MPTPFASVRAAIFDVDGTVINTKELILRGYLDTLTALHPELSIDIETVRQALGPPVRETYALLQAEPTDPRAEVLRRAHNATQNGLAHLITEYAEMIGLLTEIRDSGRKVGMFTSGNFPHLDRNFGALDIVYREHFDAIVTLEDPCAHKPSGEGVLLCCKKLGVGPSEAAMIGDSHYDMLAARDAEVGLAIGIAHGFGTKDELLEAGADIVVNDAAELAAVLLPREDGEPNEARRTGAL